MSTVSLNRGTYTIDCNSVIQNTSIDMGGNVIINGGTPINGSDLVNKDYVDSVSGAGIPISNITITGINNWSTAVSNLVGVFTIYIKNTVTDGPSAVFIVSKNSSSEDGSCHRLSVSPGLTTDEHIDLRWLAGSYIEVSKTGTGYDGLYKVSYTGIS